MKKNCKMECGEQPWCCCVDIKLIPIENSSLMELLEYRGYKIYRCVHPKYVGYVCINENIKCKYASKNGCEINSKKPLFCQDFPSEYEHILFLPSKCPYSSMDNIVKIEDLKLLSYGK